MTGLALAPFVCTVLCAAMAAALIARDPGLKVSRVLAMVPAATAWWAACQTLWTLEPDPAVAVWWVRLSGIGWMSLGPLCLHVFVELAGSRAGPALRRAVGMTHAAAASGIVLYVATPWCLTRVVPTAWGWSWQFGPVFPVAYMAALVPCSVVLLRWRLVELRVGSRGERRVSHALFAGVLAGLVAASVTDVALPALGRSAPPLGVCSITVVLIVIASQLRRFGYSMLSPAAYAEEILESLADGVALLYPDGGIRRANGPMAALVGQPAAALCERPMRELLPDLPRPGALRAGFPDRETWLRTADGATLPVSVSACALERTAGGALLGAAVVVRDLRDVAGLRDRLVTSARLAAVGELSGGIAREIQEPIAGVRRELDALRDCWARLADAGKRAPEDAAVATSGEEDELLGEGEELIEECIEGVDRVAAIVRDVAGLSDRHAAEPEPVDVRRVLERALRQTLPREDARLRVELDLRPLPPVLGYSQQLEQVFANLLQNAVHAVAGAGRLRVATRAEGDRVRVRVEDDGHGIPDDVRERIFDPFFTTKPVGEGTGLGLAISYHIVQAHRGRIRVDSRPGHGAVFEVELPGASGRDRERDEGVRLG